MKRMWVALFFLVLLPQCRCEGAQVGEACEVDADCQSGRCIASACVPPAQKDGGREPVEPMVEPSEEPIIDIGPVQCPPGLHDCGVGKCINLQTNPNHCGKCERVCGGALICYLGLCQVFCPYGSKCVVGNQEFCVDLQTDSQHCGTCNHPCQPKESCSNGVCN